MDLSQLQQTTHSLAEAVQKKFANEGKGKKDFTDTRMWKMTRRSPKDPAYSVIRFLPQAPADVGTLNVPFVSVSKHYIGPNGIKEWLVEPCPYTLGKTCPVCTWANAEKKIQGTAAVRKYFSQKETYMNVLVVYDPVVPENNGKVFLYKCPKSVQKIIENALTPGAADDVNSILPITAGPMKPKQPINAFDLWKGADFVLQVRHTDQTDWDYSTSDFLPPSKVGRWTGQMLPHNQRVPEIQPYTDAEMEEVVWHKEYSLQEFIDPKQFTEESLLQQRFNNFLNNVSNKKNKTSPAVNAETGTLLPPMPTNVTTPPPPEANVLGSQAPPVSSLPKVDFPAFNVPSGNAAFSPPPEPEDPQIPSDDTDDLPF